MPDFETIRSGRRASDAWIRRLRAKGTEYRFHLMGNFGYQAGKFAADTFWWWRPAGSSDEEFRFHSLAPDGESPFRITFAWRGHEFRLNARDFDWMSRLFNTYFVDNGLSLSARTRCKEES